MHIFYLYCSNNVVKCCFLKLISGIATTRKYLQDLGKCTLLSVQAERLDVNLNSCIDKIICELVRMKALSPMESDQSR